MDHRTRRGTDEFLVQWEGFPVTDATWEPADTIREEVPEFVRLYEDLHTTEEDDDVGEPEDIRFDEESDNRRTTEGGDSVKEPTS